MKGGCLALLLFLASTVPVSGADDDRRENGEYHNGGTYYALTERCSRVFQWAFPPPSVPTGDLADPEVSYRIAEQLARSRLRRFRYLRSLGQSSGHDVYYLSDGTRYKHVKSVHRNRGRYSETVNDSNNERHAYQWDYLLGLGVVPPTVVNRDGEVVQAMVPTAPRGERAGEGEIERRARRIRFLEMVAFDVTNQQGGTERNGSVRDGHGRPWAIDFGRTSRRRPLDILRTDAANAVAREATLAALREVAADHELFARLEWLASPAAEPRRFIAETMLGETMAGLYSRDGVAREQAERIVRRELDIYQAAFRRLHEAMGRERDRFQGADTRPDIDLSGGTTR